jgi:apolipoprotein N-acyltransferase
MGWLAKFGRVLGLAGLSGVLLALCFPPFNVAGLVWVGMIPVLALLWRGGGEKRRGWYGFRVGWTMGLVFWAINLKWIGEVSGVGVWAMAGFLGLYFGIWGGFAATAGNPWRRREQKGDAMWEAGRSLWYAALLAFYWCGWEWVRGWFLTGFGWNGLGVAFHETPVIAQMAELIGATGLAFLPVFLSAIILQVAVRLFAEARSGTLRPHWDFGVTALFLMCVVGFGIWKLQRLPAGEVQPLDVLLIQVNIPQNAKQREWTIEEVYRGYEEETLKAFAQLEERNAKKAEAAIASGEELTLDAPDWLLWPETALDDALFVTEKGEQGLSLWTQRLFGQIDGAGSFQHLFGMVERDGVREGDSISIKEGGRVFNALMVRESGSLALARHHKQHLVMFGETIPYVEQLVFLKWLFEVSSGVEYTGSFDVGSGSDPLRVPSAEAESGEIAVIPSVCFEDTVPRLLRKFALEGGQIIVNVTNDGWFRESEGAAQHFANARFRTIELRRPMVRSSNTGVTAVVGVDGRVRDVMTGEQRILVDDSGSHFTAGNLFATAYVPVDGEITLYARFGDWFSALGLLLGIGWGVTGRLRRR